MAELFVALDREYNIVFVNRALAEGTSRGYDEFVGNNHWELWPEMRGSLVEDNYERAFATGIPARFQYFYERSGIWVDVNAYPSDGYLHVYFTDITKEKLAEQELAAREESLRRLIDAIPHVTWVTDTEGRMVYINSKWREYTGVDGMDVSQIRDAIHPEDLDSVMSRMQRSRQTGVFEPYDLRLRRGDGEYRWFRVKTAPMTEPGLPGRYIGTSTDVHEEIIAFEQLRATQSSFAMAAKAARLGWWTRDFRTGEVTWSPELEEVFGLEPGSFAGSRINFVERIHPDDRNLFLEIVAAALEQREDYSVEFRFLRPDGSQGWMEGRGRAVYDSSGEPVMSYGVGLDVTDRKLAERALEESAKRYRLLAESVPVMVWTADPNGEVDFVSNRWLDYFGVSLEAARSGEWTACIHDDDRPYVINEWSACIQARQAFQVQYRLRRHDGQYRWHLALAKPDLVEGQLRGWIGSIVDVHEQKTKEATLRFLVDLEEVTRRLEDPQEVMSVTVAMLAGQLGVHRCLYGEFETDEDHCVILGDFTDGVRSVVGMQRLSDFGEDWLSAHRRGENYIIRDVGKEVADPKLQQKFAEFEFSATVSVPLVKHDRLVARMAVHSAAPRDWTQEEIELIQMVVDRSWANIERIRAGRELEQRVRERTAELLAANEALQGFTYHVSHDLRTPLRAIVSTSRILQEDFGAGLSEPANLLLNRQVDAATKLGHLIDDLLRISRLSREELNREPIDLSALAREAAQEALMGHPNSSVTVEVAEGLLTEGDSKLLRLALVNLIENGVKYSPNGGAVRVDRLGDAFVVSDEGIGIPKQYWERIFEPFQRLHRDEEFRGTGVGLSNVRQVITRHGGRVWVESETGRGSQFFFTLG